MNTCKRCGSNQIQIVNVCTFDVGTFKAIHSCLDCATNWATYPPLVWIENEPVLAGKVLS